MGRVFVLLLLPAQVCTASFEREGEGARIPALGGAGVGSSGDPWGILLNPACAMGAGVTCLAVVHAPATFGLRELRRSGFILVESGSWGSLAASGMKFGFDLYRELSFRASLGMVVTNGLRAGVALQYHRLAIPGYGSAGSVGTDIGLLWTPTGEVQIGFSATNVNAPVIGRSRERLPQIIGVGAAYAPAPGLLVLCDLVKDIRFPPELRFGIEYSPLEQLALRAGAGRDPSTFGGGIGITVAPLILDYSVVRHEALGFTHRIGLMIRLGDE